MSFCINWAYGFNLMIIEYAPQSSTLTSSFHKLYRLINIESHSEQENPGPKKLCFIVSCFTQRNQAQIFRIANLYHIPTTPINFRSTKYIDEKRQQQWHRKWKLQEKLSIFLLIRISIKESPKLSKILGSNCYISQNEEINKFF